MKRILLIIAVCAASLLIRNNVQAQTIVPTFSPFSDPNNVVQFGVVPTGTRNNIGQLESGDYGIINSNSAKWLGLGSAPAGAGASVYGKRIQWGQNFAVFNLRENTATDKDLAIQWGGTSDNNQLFFEYATSPFAVPTRVMQLESNGNVGIGATPGSLDKLRVNGRIRFGSVEYFEDGGAFTTTSGASIRPSITHRYDLGSRSFRWRNIYLSGRIFRTFKLRAVRNVKAVPYGINTIMQLNPISFDMDGEGTDLGLDPNEVQNVVREAVVNPATKQELDEKGSPIALTEEVDLGINYEALIPVLIKAMQEQQQLIDQMSTKIETMQTQLDNTKPGGPKKRQESLPTLNGSELKAEVLQNAPNPFNQESSIDFFLPSTVQTATLYIYNMKGEIIKKSRISDRGSASFQISANTLSPGIYMYTVIADNKDLGVKKMIVLD